MLADLIDRLIFGHGKRNDILRFFGRGYAVKYDCRLSAVGAEGRAFHAVNCQLGPAGGTGVDIHFHFLVG